MLCGIVAGLFAFVYAHQIGEPQIGRAIAFESAHRAAGEAPDVEIFSRSVQSGIGLFTAVMAVGVALGGLFSLGAAIAYGRVGALGIRAIAALLAGAAFVALNLGPNLKYPANPPSVGAPETIGIRTELFFSMLGISVAVMIAAIVLGVAWSKRYGVWNAVIGAGVLYIVLVVAAAAVLPEFDEVPADFSAVVLWKFRVASFGTYAILWGTLGLLFGYLSDRAERRAVSGSRSLRATRVP
jgi:hypothetical protein